MGFYSGVFNTTINPTQLNRRSFAASMLRLFPDGSAPIFALTSQTGRSTAKSTTHAYFTKTLAFGSATTTAAYAAGETALAVVSSANLAVNNVIYNPTSKENMLITAIPDATHITVTRAFGRVALANIANAQQLVAIGSAFAEGSARPTARGLTIVYVPNFTQIFRNAWALTDTARASLTELGFTNISESRKDCSLIHSVDQESALIFGQPYMDTTGAQPLHATQGIIDAIDQYAAANDNTAGGTTTLTQLITLLEPAWAFSHDMGDAKTRMGFAGATAMKVVNEIARLNGVVQLLPDQTSFGFRFARFKFYKGELILVEHPILNGIPQMAKLLIGIDMPALKLAYMEGRDALPEEFGGSGRNNANGVDSQGGSITSEWATELMNPIGCFIIRGLTAGAAG